MRIWPKRCNDLRGGLGIVTISFIIPAWNHYDLMLQCLDAIRAHADGVWEVVVVDNGSRPEEVDRLLRDAWWGSRERVRMLALEASGGQVPGNGMSERLASDAWVSGGQLAKDRTPCDQASVQSPDAWNRQPPSLDPDHSLLLVRLPVNTGFSVAVNIGIRHARGDLLVLLNNDVLIEPGFTTAIRSAMSAHPAWLHAATKIRQFHQPDLLDDVGNALLPTGRAVKLGYAERDADRYDTPAHGARILSACGAAAVYRRAFFEAVGLFDEDFFAYLEDVDLGLRAQRMGYPCGWIHDAVSRHIGSATTGSMKNAFTVRLLARNQVSLLVKNLPGSLWLLLGLPIVCTMGAQWLKYALARNGNGKAYAAGLSEGVRVIGAMRAKRRVAKKGWIQSGMALMRMMRSGARAYRMSKKSRVRIGTGS